MGDYVDEAAFGAERAAEAAALILREYNSKVAKAKGKKHVWSYLVEYADPHGDVTRR
jgi:hypothetical protein